MSRYIDADATELAVIKATTYGDALRAVREQQSIDIVRCKECKHWHKWSDWEMFCGHFDGGIGSDADDFCSYGEREGE